MVLATQHVVLSLNPRTCVESLVSWCIIIIPALGAEPAWPGRGGWRQRTTLKPGTQPPQAHHGQGRMEGSVSEGLSRHRFESQLSLPAPWPPMCVFLLEPWGPAVESRQPAFILGLLARLDEMVHLRKVLEAFLVVIASAMGIRFSVL